MLAYGFSSIELFFLMERKIEPEYKQYILEELKTDRLQNHYRQVK
jgi:hypothetical protein